MASLVRRRPLLRAVAIGGGAYLDCMVRIESARFLDSLRETGSARAGAAGTDAGADRRAGFAPHG